MASGKLKKGTFVQAEKVFGHLVGPWGTVVLRKSKDKSRWYREGDWNQTTVTSKGRGLEVT